MRVAKLMRFYGMSYNEVQELPSDVATQLEQAMTTIQAQEFFGQLQAVCYPKMKEEAQRRVHRDMHRLANPFQEAKVVTPQELLRMVHG